MRTKASKEFLASYVNICVGMYFVSMRTCTNSCIYGLYTYDVIIRIYYLTLYSMVSGSELHTILLI